MDIRKLQRAIVDGLEDVKAQNIAVYNTEHITPLFERVIIASGSSNRQTKALASSVRETVKERGFQVLRTEGEDNGEWIIVDCGAAVAHIMQPAIREYYHLEELWGSKPVRLKLGTDGPARASEAAEDDDDEPVVSSKAPSKANGKANGKADGKADAEAASKPPRKAAAKTSAKPAGTRAARADAATAAKPVAAKKTAARKTAGGGTATARSAAGKTALAGGCPARPRAAGTVTRSSGTKGGGLSVTQTVKVQPAARKTAGAAKTSVATKVPAKKAASTRTVATKTPARKTVAKKAATKSAAVTRGRSAR